MASSPRCPMCGSAFDIPDISGGYVRCPKCLTEMFQYRFDGDEDMSPKRFMSLLNPRANEAVITCRDWFPGRSRHLRMLRALAFVVRLWPVLAEVFQKEPTHVE